MVKIDENIRMVKYESKKINTFCLSHVFGYGQYLIHEGMYDLFLNELESESHRISSAKDEKRIRKEQKQKEKKKQMLEQERKKQLLSVGLSIFDKMYSKKYKVNYKKVNGVSIAIPQILNAKMESNLFKVFESDDVLSSKMKEMRSNKLKDKKIENQI